MNAHLLAETARDLVGAGRGLLAMDESTATCNRRFAEVGIPETEPMRRAWRDLIVTTPNLSDEISGAILFDETIRQTTLAGVPFPRAMTEAGIIVGIKVDAGAKPLAGHAGETITEGLDGLRERLQAYAALGARFAKWRAVISIGDGLPSRGAALANAHALARYAALCQEADIVPIVEPEVLMDGDHDLARCRKVTETMLEALFDQLREQRVALEGLILKPNMVTPGAGSGEAASVEAVARATLHALSRAVPAAVAGVAFLSGGQSGPVATAHLNAMNILARAPAARAPWPLVFSFARAIQHPALNIWKGDAANVETAQKALRHRARCARAALIGEYTEDVENGVGEGWVR